jgi:hypothetical protein
MRAIPVKVSSCKSRFWEIQAGTMIPVARAMIGIDIAIQKIQMGWGSTGRLLATKVGMESRLPSNCSATSIQSALQLKGLFVGRRIDLTKGAIEHALSGTSIKGGGYIYSTGFGKN